jgi:hypothetical protein
VIAYLTLAAMAEKAIQAAARLPGAGVGNGTPARFTATSSAGLTLGFGPLPAGGIKVGHGFSSRC